MARQYFLALVALASMLGARALAGNSLIEGLVPIGKTESRSFCQQRAIEEHAYAENCYLSGEWGSSNLVSHSGFTKVAIRAIADEVMVGHFYVVRIEIVSASSGWFSVQQRVHPDSDMGGKGGVLKIDKLYRGSLTKSDIVTLLDIIDKSHFWSMAHQTGEGCADGEPWTIEVIEAGHHNIVDQNLACDSKTGIGPLGTAIGNMLSTKRLPKELKNI
jgi:hypothetical protein